MQASWTTTGIHGSETMDLPKVVGLRGQGVENSLALLLPGLEGEDIAQPAAPMGAHLAEGQVPRVHPPHDERPRHAEDRRRLVRGEVPVLLEDRDPAARVEAL